MGKSDQLMVYASRLFSRVEHNYNISEIVALAMIFAQVQTLSVG
jgi:hypothetical protein